MWIAQIMLKVEIQSHLMIYKTLILGNYYVFIIANVKI